MAPAVFELKPSRQLRGYLTGLLALAAVALFIADLAMGWRMVGLAALALGTFVSLRPRTAARLRCHEDGRLELWDRGAWRETAPQAGMVVLPGLTVLRLRPEGLGRSLSVVALPDSLPAEELRRLRVWLRWRARI